METQSYQTKTYPSGDKIIAEGAYGGETFRILSGKVLICKETGQQKGFTLAELGEGEVFGEMYVLEQTGFRSASARAKTEVIVEMISRQEIEDALKETPSIIRDMLHSLSKRLDGTSQDFSVNTQRLTKSQQPLMMVGIGLLCLVLSLQLWILFR